MLRACNCLKSRRLVATPEARTPDGSNPWWWRRRPLHMSVRGMNAGAVWASRWRFAPWARSALRAFGKRRWRKPFRDFGRVQKMRAFAQSSLEKLCARSRLEGNSALGQCRCKSDIRFEPIAGLPPKRLCGAYPWTSVGAGPNNLFVQLETRNVVDGRGWYPAFWLIIKRVVVIATLRRHGRHGAVRTIGAIICRSPPVSVIVVAVVLSIAGSCACNERTNHQCQCCDILKYPAHDWVLFFGSLLLRQPKLKSDFLLVGATQE